nr:carbohydrate kinase family protein [Candidatus Gracilibacteria bacterium]
MTKILISGSMAYDYIMDFGDSFKNHIMPDKIHMLSVSFFTPKLSKEKGGTGHNIAYNMGLLGEKAILLGAVGNDFTEKSEIIDYSNLHKVCDNLTASCYIINDKENNQISAFYPGAMSEASSQDIPKENISYAIISPNDKETMKKHLKQSFLDGIKTFFDPGQQITNISKEELIECLNYTNYLILNDYEYSLFQEKTGISENDLINKIEKIIVTLGKQGVKIIDKNGISQIDAVKEVEVIDPTGAGDSFRAGLIVGLNRGKSWEQSCKIGALTASFCIKQYGTQKHFFTNEEFETSFEKNFGTKINL